MGRTDMPSLLLLTRPDGHEVDPHAWADLERHATRVYGARVVLTDQARISRTPRPILLGAWRGHDQLDVLRDLAPRIAAAFFTLDWLEGVL